MHTDFFIRIIFIRTPRCKTLKIKNFLRIILMLAYHNLKFLLSNVIQGKIKLLLPNPVLLLPEVPYCPIKSICFPYKYFWIQVWLQLVTFLGAEKFSMKEFAKFSAQSFANDKHFRGINFGKVEIYTNVLINYSNRKLIQILENYRFWSIVWIT